MPQLKSAFGRDAFAYITSEILNFNVYDYYYIIWYMYTHIYSANRRITIERFQSQTTRFIDGKRLNYKKRMGCGFEPATSAQKLQ